MKPLFCIVALLIMTHSIRGNEKFKQITINFGGILPVYKSPNTIRELTIVPDAEFLLNLPLNTTIQLSTGIGIESGKHIVLEDVARLIWVNDAWKPYEVRYYWNLDFLSMKVPIYVSMPFYNSFLNSYTFGVGFGYLLNYKLTEESLPNTSHIKINRSFLDLSFGVKKQLFQFNKVSLGLSPEIGYRAYLSDHNNWLKKCFFGELKFNVSF